MPLFHDSGLGGEGQLSESASLPGPTVIIDMRQNGSGSRLIKSLAADLEDLTREMRLNQVFQWRYLSECIDFLELDSIGFDPDLKIFHGFVIKSIDEVAWPLPDKNDLVAYIGKHYLNKVRNSRINAIKDIDEQISIADLEQENPEQSTVRVFFLTDLEEEKSFMQAALYASWLKEWCDQNSGPTRLGRDDLIETVVICMNAAPHRHYNLLNEEKALGALDIVILVQVYRDDDGYVDEEAQLSQVELMLYTLLLYWPESLKKTHWQTLDDPDGVQTIYQPTYIIGISALEYSARCAARWLDYALSVKIIQTLRDAQEVQSGEQHLEHEVEIWWHDWLQRLRSLLAGTMVKSLSNLQALDQLQALTASPDFCYSSSASIEQELATFCQYVAQLYTGPGGVTLQFALETAPHLPTQLKQLVKQNTWQEDEASAEEQSYQRLSELLDQAQLFLLPIFQGASGALPRAQRQFLALCKHVNKLKQVVENPPNLNEYRTRFEGQAQEAQKRLEQLRQAQQPSPPVRKLLVPIRKSFSHRKQLAACEQAYQDLCATVQLHLAEVREVIVANVALTILRCADIYDPNSVTGPYQHRLKLLDQQLSEAQHQATQQLELAQQRLKSSLPQEHTDVSRKSTWENLNSRKDMLKWDIITDSFLQSCDKLQSNEALNLLAEMLLRRLGAEKPSNNGWHQSGRPYIHHRSAQTDGERHFHAISSSLVAALLTSKVGNSDLNDILPLLNQYTQMKTHYLAKPTALHSDVLNVRQAMRETMLHQAIYGKQNSSFSQKRDLPAEFVLSAWVETQHAVNPVLTEALDSRNLILYMQNSKNAPSQMLTELDKRNRLVGYPDERAGDDYYYLLLPPDEESEVFLNALDFAQAAQIHPVRFPDKEKILYLHIHRIRQL